MSENSQGIVGKTLDQSLYIWKVASAFIGLTGVALSVWASTLGPGIKKTLQDFLGVTTIIERIEFVEHNMPPPRVVDWDEARSRQQGQCSNLSCIYVLTGARTSYGEDCGPPIETSPFVRLKNGQIFRVGYRNFDPFELSRTMTSFSVPLLIPEFIPPGQHAWRTRSIYPHCQGQNEPVPRWTPWFPLEVSEHSPRH